MKRFGKSGTWLAPFLLALLLLAATLLLYAPVRDFSFLIWDDDEYVTANPQVQSGLTAAGAAWAFTTPYFCNWQPLTFLSHMSDASLFGMRPAGHHGMNLLFHAANVLLLFFLLHRATGCLGRSFFVAALFALHPLNVESVAWIAERKNLLSTFFFLLALGGYGWYARNPNWKRYLAFTAAFVASLMSKPMAVTFPFVLLLLDYWPLSRLPDPFNRLSPGTGSAPLSWWRQAARLALEKLPLFLVAAVFSQIAVVAQGRGGCLVMHLPLSLRLGNAMHSYWEYVRMAFWPSRLAIFYPYPALPFWKVLLCALFLAAITGCVLWQHRRKYLVFGWFFFLGTLVPVVGIVQMGKYAMADRFAYIPLLGLFIMVVWLAAEALAALRLPRAVTAAVGACFLLAAAFVTHANLWYWQDSIALFTHAQEVYPAPDSTIELELGVALFSAGFMDAGLQHYRLAESIDPQNGLVHYDIATALMAEGELAPAVPELQAALRYTTNDRIRVASLSNLGVLYFQLGHSEDAWQSFTAALRLNPRYPRSLMGLGNLLYRQGRYAEAADQFSRALAIEPTAQGWLWLAESLEAAGNPAPALAAYEKALQLNPNLTEAREHIDALSPQPR
jgi:tetratricopeptide (TPR) repeat protein